MQKYRFSLWKLLLVIAVVACLLAVWSVWARDVLTVSNGVDEPDRHQYYSGFTIEPTLIENVLGIDGTFKRRNSIGNTLYYVRSGQVESVCNLGHRRSPNSLGESWLLNVGIRVALVHQETETGTVTQLCVVGLTRGGGGIGEIEHRIRRTFSKTYNGTITPNQNLLTYVSGDTDFKLEPTSTIEEFAAQNNGNYLVVATSFR